MKFQADELDKEVVDTINYNFRELRRWAEACIKAYEKELLESDDLTKRKMYQRNKFKTQVMSNYRRKKPVDAQSLMLKPNGNYPFPPYAPF